MTAGWTMVPGDSDHSENQASNQVPQATKSLHEDQGFQPNAFDGKPKKGEVAKWGALG